MIELSGETSFEKAVEEFLLMDAEEREFIMEQLDKFLSAAEWACHLEENQQSH